MRMMLSIALLFLGTAPSLAQVRRAMICKEQSSIALKQSAAESDLKLENTPKSTFSITFSREYLTVISVGKSDLYECQKISYRSNRNRASNTIKCQNATNFLTLDLIGLKFVKSQMDPEDETDVGLSYGTCSLL